MTTRTVLTGNCIDTGLVGEGSEELAESVSILSKVGTFFKILGAVGLVVTLITGIIEAVEGAEQYVLHPCSIFYMSLTSFGMQKDQAHRRHPPVPAGRLDIAYFKREATNILQQLELMADYLDALPGGSDPDEDAAAYVSPSNAPSTQIAEPALLCTAVQEDREERPGRELEDRLDGP